MDCPSPPFLHIYKTDQFIFWNKKKQTVLFDCPAQEQQREAEKEDQEVTTMVYLAVSIQAIILLC